ncbi:hypothetical protein, partial [Mesorhizobium sp. M4B.F.Ca.ET.172.01.1.1]|uniref:hypothetical protein n=1 Tax=Mesorhizobium sp. M4B.F.Ca.ET.172.01.1.1 TaxID=2563950 RepID=UPI00165187CA
KEERRTFASKQFRIATRRSGHGPTPGLNLRECVSGRQLYRENRSNSPDWIGGIVNECVVINASAGKKMEKPREWQGQSKGFDRMKKFVLMATVLASALFGMSIGSRAAT